MQDQAGVQIQWCANTFVMWGTAVTLIPIPMLPIHASIVRLRFKILQQMGYAQVVHFFFFFLSHSLLTSYLYMDRQCSLLF